MDQEKTMNLQLDQMKRNLLIGSLIGDAYVLGAHWIYDVDRIETRFGDYLEPAEPMADSYHRGKHRGDQTHYGDQAIWLLEFLQKNNGIYDGLGFRTFWRERMSRYSGYIDTASQETLTRLAGGERYGYSSDELGGAARIAPVLYLLQDPASALAAAVDQARLTHQDPLALLVTDLFARAALRMMAGDTRPVLTILRDARDERATLLKANNPDDVLIQRHVDITRFDHALEKAERFLGTSAREIAGSLGQSCHAPHALPAMLAIFKITENYREAMQLNVHVGGDSAARAMLIGLLLGIRAKPGDIPESWVSVWKAREWIFPT